MSQHHATYKLSYTNVVRITSAYSEVASRQHLRSASRHQLLLMPRYRFSTLGRRAFADDLRTYSSG